MYVQNTFFCITYVRTYVRSYDIRTYVHRYTYVCTKMINFTLGTTLKLAHTYVLTLNIL